MAAALGYMGMLIGTLGIFFGFLVLSRDPGRSLQIVTLTTVGLVGVLAFVRHVVFHAADARLLGWESDRPGFAYEVGFANLAFGAMGLITSLCPRVAHAQGIVVLGYALYLLQAALLHGYLHFTDGTKSPARLWKSCVATLLFAGMMSFFALRQLLA